MERYRAAEFGLYFQLLEDKALLGFDIDVVDSEEFEAALHEAVPSGDDDGEDSEFRDKNNPFSSLDSDHSVSELAVSDDDDNSVVGLSGSMVLSCWLWSIVLWM